MLCACAAGQRAFRHEAHLSAAKGACIPCHGANPAMPRFAALSDCEACHPRAGGPAEAGRYRPGPPVLPDSYEDVLFSHGSHAGAGMTCAACHGEKGAPVFPTMSDCTVCHNREGGPTACRSCHRKFPGN